jgi:hypothetical protein
MLKTCEKCEFGARLLAAALVHRIAGVGLSLAVSAAGRPVLPSGPSRRSAAQGLRRKSRPPSGRTGRSGLAQGKDSRLGEQPQRFAFATFGAASHFL